MQVRTFRLAKFSGVISTCPDSTGDGARKGKGQGREKERRGKGKGRRHDEREGRKESMGNSDGGGGIAPLLLGGIDATAWGWDIINYLYTPTVCLYVPV